MQTPSPFESDAEFLAYVETHSQSERAVFAVGHIVHLFNLAGRRVPARFHDDDVNFVTARYESIDTLISEAQDAIS